MRLNRLFLLVACVSVPCVLMACGKTDPKVSSGKYYDHAKQLADSGDEKGALIELRNALEADKSNVSAYLLRARIALDSGAVADAVADLRVVQRLGAPPSEWIFLLGRALELRGDVTAMRNLVSGTKADTAAVQVEEQALLGYAAMDESNFVDARTNFEAALAADPRDIDAILGMIQLSTVSGLDDDAGAWIAKAQDFAPNDPLVMMATIDRKVAKGDIGGAETRLRKLVSLYPLHPGYRTRLAQVLIAESKTAEATKILDAVLASVPDYPIAMHLRAYVYYRSGDYKKTDDLETKVLAGHPQFAQAQAVDGYAKFHLGQYQQAESLMHRASSNGVNDPELVMLRGLSLVAIGAPEEGYELLQTMAGQMDHNVDYLTASAEAAGAANNLPASRDLFQKALLLSPSNTGLLTQLAKVEAAQGESDKAVAQLQQAHKLSPGDRKITDTLFVLLLQTKQLDRAMEIATDERTAAPAQSSGWVMQGMVQAAEHNFDGAMTSFQTGLKLDPSSADCVGNLASIYMMRGKMDQARALVNQAYAKYPDSAAIDAVGVRVETRANNVGAVQTWLERAVAADPSNSTYRTELMNLLVSQHQSQDAIKLGLTGLEMAPKDTGLERALATAYLTVGSTTDAEQLLDGLIEREPSADNYILLAQVYELKHDDLRLRGALQEVLERAPDYRPAILRLAGLMVRRGGGSTADAEKLIDKLSAKTPSDPDVIELKARLAYRDQGPEAGEAILEAAVAGKKDPPRQLEVLLSSMYWDRGQHTLAENVAKQWLAAHPEDARERLTLATFQIATDQYADAIVTLGPEVADNPKDWIALNNMAYSQFRLGKLAEAQATISKALKLAGSQPNILDTAGQIALAQGANVHAEDLLRAANAVPNPSPGNQYHLAQALVANGKNAEAKQILEAIGNEDTGSFPQAGDAAALLQKLSQ